MNSASPPRGYGPSLSAEKFLSCGLSDSYAKPYQKSVLGRRTGGKISAWVFPNPLPGAGPSAPLGAPLGRLSPLDSLPAPPRREGALPPTTLRTHSPAHGTAAFLNVLEGSGVRITVPWPPTLLFCAFVQGVSQGWLRGCPRSASTWPGLGSRPLSFSLGLSSVLRSPACFS